MNMDIEPYRLAVTLLTEIAILAAYYFILKAVGYIDLLKTLYFLKRARWEKADTQASLAIAGRWTPSIVRLCCLRLRACARSQRGLLPEALEDCNRVLDKNPKNWRALYLRGCLLHDLGRSQEALETLRNALDRNHKNSHGWYVRGLCARKVGHSHESLQAFTRCWKLAPHFLEARRKRAELLAEIGRYQEALVEFAALPKIFVDCSPKLLLAQHLLASERFSEAAFWAGRYVQDTDEPGGHIVMALAYGALDEHDRALECLNRALNHSISSFTLWIRGINHLFRGDAWGAVQDFEWAVALSGSRFPQAEEALRQTRASAGLDVLPQHVSVSLN